MDATEVKVWRRQERARLIALRMGIPSSATREWDRALATLLYPAYERQGPRGKVCLDAEWW